MTTVIAFILLASLAGALLLMEPRGQHRHRPGPQVPTDVKARIDDHTIDLSGWGQQ